MFIKLLFVAILSKIEFVNQNYYTDNNCTEKLINNEIIGSYKYKNSTYYSPYITNMSKVLNGSQKIPLFVCTEYNYTIANKQSIFRFIYCYNNTIMSISYNESGCPAHSANKYKKEKINKCISSNIQKGIYYKINCSTI